MRKLVAVLAIVLSCAGAATAFAATRTVKVGDDWFVRKGKPTSITVKPGTKLKFKWTGKSPHNVFTQSGPSKPSSPVKTKGTWSSPKLKKGTYVFYCAIHGAAVQRVTVKVK